MNRTMKKWLSILTTLTLTVGVFSQFSMTSASVQTQAAEQLDADHLISAGMHHSMALKEDGSVWTWGYNSYGQLGDGTKINKSTPQQITVQEGKKATYIENGENFSLAILEDGTLWGWGDGGKSQLGQFMATGSTTPIQIVIGDGSKKVASVSAGDAHVLAILEDGSLWTWGNNSDGQLGLGQTSDPVHTPTQITIENDKKVVYISAGSNYSTAILEDGSLWTWGNNLYGMLGDGTRIKKPTPQKITIEEGKKVTKTSTANYCMGAILEDGTFWMWGYNQNGQLGDGTTESPKTTPQKITIGEGKKAVGISCSQFQTAAILEDGSLWAWGVGCLGAGVEETSSSPKEISVEAEKKVEAVSLGTDHTMVVSESGTLWAWGDNSWNAVGVEGSNQVLSPVSLMQLFTPLVPTLEPTTIPTVPPTSAPTATPTITPPVIPTIAPTTAPTITPTATPTVIPPTPPTTAPTVIPTTAPTTGPTVQPTTAPTVTPTAIPVSSPYEITGITTADGQIKVDVNRLKQREQEDFVLIALYDDNGILTGIQTNRYSVTDADTQSFLFPSSGIDFSLVKVFVWDGLNSMTPLSVQSEKTA